MNSEDDQLGVSPEQKLRELYARIDKLELAGNWPAAQQLARDACEIARAVYGPHDPSYVHACNVLERVEGIQYPDGETRLRAATKKTPPPPAPKINLIPCAACGHSISEAAEACPQCGHPLRRAPTKRLECHACAETATTRCQSCNVLSCAEHVQSIYVSHGKSGAYELRCPSCYASAEQRKAVRGIILAIFVAIVLFMFLAVASQMHR